MCLAGSPRENTRTNLFCVWSKKVELCFFHLLFSGVSSEIA